MPGQAAAQTEVSSCWEQICAARAVKQSCFQGALYVFPPSTSCWSCGRIPLGWSGQSSAPDWNGICRGTSSPRRWHHRNEQTPAIRRLFFRFMSWGWSYEKGKTQCALQGVVPCQCLDGKCDKECLFLGVWPHELRAGLCHLCCIGQQESRCKQQQVGLPRVLAQPHKNLCHVFIPVALRAGRWEAGVVGFPQSMSIVPNPMQKEAELLAPWGLVINWVLVLSCWVWESLKGQGSVSKSEIWICHLASGPRSFWQSRAMCPLL